MKWEQKLLRQREHDGWMIKSVGGTLLNTSKMRLLIVNYPAHFSRPAWETASAKWAGYLGQILIVFNKGDAHPRVTGCPAKHRAFVKIEKEMEYRNPRKSSRMERGYYSSLGYHGLLCCCVRQTTWSTPYWQYDIPCGSKAPSAS